LAEGPHLVRVAAAREAHAIGEDIEQRRRRSHGFFRIPATARRRLICYRLNPAQRALIDEAVERFMAERTPRRSEVSQEK